MPQSVEEWRTRRFISCTIHATILNVNGNTVPIIVYTYLNDTSFTCLKCSTSTSKDFFAAQVMQPRSLKLLVWVVGDIIYYRLFKTSFFY